MAQKVKSIVLRAGAEYHEVDGKVESFLESTPGAVIDSLSVSVIPSDAYKRGGVIYIAWIVYRIEAPSDE